MKQHDTNRPLIRRSVHSRGFVQVLPLALLAFFASVIFVVVGQVQRQNQDIRSRAGVDTGMPGSGLYPPTTTPRPPETPTGAPVIGES